MLNTVMLFAAVGVFAIGFIAGMFFGAISSPWVGTETPSDRSPARPCRVERSDGMFDRGADGDHLYRQAVRR